MAATARASSGCPAASARRPSPRRGGARAADRSAGSALSTSWSSAAASTSRRSTGDAARVDPRREPAGDLRDGARVPHEPGLGIQGEQEGGGLHPPGNGHRSDGTRRSSPDPIVAGARRSPAGAPVDARAALAFRHERGDRDRAAERRGAPPATVAAWCRRGRPRPSDAHGHAVRPRSRRRPSRRGPSAARARPRREPLEGHPGRDARTGSRHPPRRRRPGPHRVDERLGGRGPAAVMGDLEQVDARQARREELRIDLLLDVAHQQEPPVPDLPEPARPTRC